MNFLGRFPKQLGLQILGILDLVSTISWFEGGTEPYSDTRGQGGHCQWIATLGINTSKDLNRNDEP
jgi:hypothetical protein